MSIVRAPATFQLNTQAPIRGSVSTPPYTLINLSVDATAWIADNPGMTAGQGTPLYPGTSIKWTRPGDLWMIADTTDCQVVVSYDVEDWQPNPAAIAAAVLNSGILVIDRPVTLFDGPLTSGPGGDTTGPLDISRYQSAFVFITGPDVADGVGNAEVQFKTASGTILTTKKIQFMSQLPATADSFQRYWQAQIPLLGSSIEIVTSYNSTSVILIASNRAMGAGMVQQISQYGTADPFVARRNFAAIAAAGIATIYTPPWFGDLRIFGRFTTANPILNTRLSVNTWNPLAAASRTMLTIRPTLTATNVYMFDQTVPCAGEMFTISVANDTVGNADLDMSVLPVGNNNY